jgi:hypothetical protein
MRLRQLVGRQDLLPVLPEPSRQRWKALDREARGVRKLLETGRVESARGRIDAADPPECDERFEHLRDQVYTRSTQARLLAAEAEETLRTDPKAAVRLFEEVRRINAESPAIDVQIGLARASARSHRSWGRTIGKVVLYSVAVAAASAGGYFAYHEYKRRRAQTNVGR